MDHFEGKNTDSNNGLSLNLQGSFKGNSSENK